MEKLFESKTQKQAAIVSGLAIVVMAIAAVIANDITIRSLIVADNPVESFNNVLASKAKFNSGVLSWLIILVSDLVVAWGLYLFFMPVNRKLSQLAAWFRLIYVAMLAVSILNLIQAQLVIQQYDQSSGESCNQLAESFMFYLEAFDAMWNAGLVIFGIHILLVALLIKKSEHVPDIFSILLILAFFGYTFPKISNLLFPAYKDVMTIIEAIFLVPMLSEVALGVWLLITGFRNNIKTT